MVSSLTYVFIFWTLLKGQNRFCTTIYGATWVYGISVHTDFEKPIIGYDLRQYQPYTNTSLIWNQR